MARGGFTGIIGFIGLIVRTWLASCGRDYKSLIPFIIAGPQCCSWPTWWRE